MISVERTREIPAAIEEVWGLVSDVDRLARWFAFGERFEVLEGTGSGERRRMYGHWGKKRSEIDQRIVDYDPPRLLGWEHEAERLDGKPAPRFAASTHFTISLEPRDARTRVTLRSEQVPASRPKAVVMRLFGTREIATSLERSLEDLERLASGSADPT